MSRRHVSLAVVSVAFLVAVAALPAAGHPPAPVDEAGRRIHGKIHTWLHRAKVPLVRGRIVIKRTPCPGHGFAACLFTSRPRVIYLGPNLYEPRRLLYHELGHSFDLLVLNGRERRQFKRIVGIRRQGWFGGGLPPAEWFADGYASCAMRLRLQPPVRPTPYGYAPTSRRHARVCALIRAAARPHGRGPQRPSNPPRVIEVQPPPREQTQPGQGSTCTFFDQLTTGCKPTEAPDDPAPPAPPPPTSPGPPLPLPVA